MGIFFRIPVSCFLRQKRMLSTIDSVNNYWATSPHTITGLLNSPNIITLVTRKQGSACLSNWKKFHRYFTDNLLFSNEIAHLRGKYLCYLRYDSTCISYQDLMEPKPIVELHPIYVSCWWTKTVLLFFFSSILVKSV